MKGITYTEIANGTAFDLAKEQLADIAAEYRSPARSGEAFPAVEVPETVTIGALSNDFEPSVFPHRKMPKPL